MRYIRTKLNAVASRGLSTSTLVKLKEWIWGPEFLWRKKGNDPQNPIDPIPNIPQLLRVKRKETNSSNDTMTQT